jgi:hypothetical protein
LFTIRFSQIKSCFHICKAANGEQLDDNADKLAKVREFFDKFISNCQNYYNLDEMMVRFNGRVDFKFVKQPKPTPNGFKLIGLVDAKSAYTYDAIVDTREKNLRKHFYILKLAEKLKDEYHTIVMDRGYSTIDLFKILLQKKIYAVGTIKKYRNLPDVIRKAKPLKGRVTGANGEELADEDDEDTLTVNSEYSVDPVSEQQTADEESKGQIELITASVISSATTPQTVDNAFLISSAPSLISGSSSTSTSNNIDDLGIHKGQWIWMAKSLDQDHKLIATAWHDSGICLAISTRHGNVLRRAKGFQNRIERTCPELIDFYNSWMGGVEPI